MPKIHAKKKKNKRRANLPPGITPETIREAFEKFLKSGAIQTPKASRGLMMFTYNQMKGMVDAFTYQMFETISLDHTDFDKERIGHATSEIFDLLKDKYDIPAMDSAVVLLRAGLHLLNRCDEEIDKARREQGI